MTDAVVVPVVPVYAEPAATPPTPVRWTPLGRFGFRLAFCYLLIYALGCGNATLWELLPKIGEKVNFFISRIWFRPAAWLALHRFHVQGVGDHLHGGGSGDTAINWIALGLIFLTAIVAALVWTALDRRRLQYQTLAAWLRFVLRLALITAMASYGLIKLFPLQMSPPSLAVLNEPLGQSSPMTLLWTLIGLNPVYEMVCGAVEMTAAVLLFFRRTALMGGLLTAFVMINVLLYNMFFDVPVKIYAAHLVLFAFAVVAPDLRALVDFFWWHRAAAPTGVWVPPAKRRAFRLGTRIAEVVFLGLILLGLPDYYHALHTQAAALRHPSPLTGEWRLDSALLTAGGHTSQKPVLTGDGVPMDALFLEPSGRTMLRSSDGVLWRAYTDVNLVKHTLVLESVFNDGVHYAMAQPLPNQLVLTPSGKDAGKFPTLQLHRVPLPTQYPLLDRGFHWVNEWGLER